LAGGCLWAKARHGATAEEAPALLQRARTAALRARELGNKSPLLNDLIQILNHPQNALNQNYSANAEASAKMKAGEQAFASGDYDAALAAYSAALKLDPKLYGAALFAGDVCFRRKDLNCAAEWFGKAIAIDPTHQTAYRYWGDTLMGAGKMLEAREQYIEAVIAEPSRKPWAALARWAQKNNCQLRAPKIDRPPAHAGELWAPYTATRAEWRESLFAQNFPAEAQYRHTLAEETAALNAVVDAFSALKTAPADPQVAALAALKNDGVLEAWILLNGGRDEGIAKDYAAYRAAHHDQLRAYLDRYIIRPNP